MSIIVALTTIGVPALPDRACAERFIEVYRGNLTGKVTLLDTDSIAASKFKFGTDLRYRVTGGSAVLQYTAVTFCGDFILWNLKVDGVSPTYTFPVREFYKEPRGWIDGVHAIAPGFTEDLGKVIATACNAANPEAIDRYLAPPPRGECSNPKDVFTKVICESGGDARGDVALLKQRTERIATECGQEEFLRTEFQARMHRASRCGDGSYRCISFAMGDMWSSINRDFGELIRWEARGSPTPFPAAEVCKSGVSLRVAAAEAQRRRDAQTAEVRARADLLACAKVGAQRLDDRASDAKVISDAAIGSCSKEANRLATASYEVDPNSVALSGEASLRAELLQFILENRAKARKTP